MAAALHHPRAAARSLAAALAVAAMLGAACARSPGAALAPPAPAAPGADSPGGPPAVPEVVPGMDAATVRRAWGDPAAVRRIPSPSAPGLVYERWSWGAPGKGREVVIVDGKAVDVLDPLRPEGAGAVAPAGPPVPARGAERGDGSPE